jgi:hypothetical protein
MSYRDDREAMLARLDALERDAVELGPLRARIAELEAENQRLVGVIAELRARLRPPALGTPPPVDAQPPGLRVEVRDDAGERVLHLTTPVVKIGSASSCQLQLVDRAVSRVHAVIERTEELVLLIDLGSDAGTRVNGEPTGRAELRDGDVIRIGDATITVAP